MAALDGKVVKETLGQHLQELAVAVLLQVWSIRVLEVIERFRRCVFFVFKGKMNGCWVELALELDAVLGGHLLPLRPVWRQSKTRSSPSSLTLRMMRLVSVLYRSSFALARCISSDWLLGAALLPPVGAATAAFADALAAASLAAASALRLAVSLARRV